MKKLAIHTIFIISTCHILGQNIGPINRFNEGFVIRHEKKPQSMFPFVSPLSLNSQDSVINDHYFKKKYGQSYWLMRKLRYEHLFSVRHSNFQLNIDPLLMLETGKETKSDNWIYRNTRGIFIQTIIGNKIGFYSMFHENQSRFMDHIASFADYYGVVPGQAYQKRFGEDAYDYAWSEGMLVYDNNQNFQIQFGHGKRFVGNGYRSVLFSDNTFSFPHMYFKYGKGNFHYHTWFSSFMNPLIPYNNVQFNLQWQRKAGVFHYLTYSMNDNFELGVFESNIIESRESNGNYNFNLLHYNPVIFLGSMDKNNNSYLGINLNARYTYFMFYGQFAINSHKAEMNAFQLGSSYSVMFPYSFLRVRLEVNHAQSHTYSFADTVLSYTHYNQPLAHPLGENFTELVFRSTLRVRTFEFEYKFNYATSKGDSIGHLPALNLFNRETNIISLDEASVRNIHELKISFIINPHYNMRISAGMFFRNFRFKSIVDQNTFIYLVFQTPLFKKYYDF